MPRIKHTKNELKAQRDALKRFERYLPTLQLKKQQLQVEVRQLETRVEAQRAEEEQVRADVRAWVRLFAEPFPWTDHLKVKSIREGQGNIAGVAIPTLENVEFERVLPDLYATPVWVDDGLRTLERLLQLRIQRRIYEEQLRRLAAELRTTNQRVNLFEKVKIPEASENIRVIRIFLGDEMTAGVARSKIAKGKSVEKARAG